jgi:hypothetical protein
MGFTITKGFSFNSASTVNAANLHALIEAATLSNGNRESIDRTRVCPIFYSATAPTSPTDGELWLNSVSGQLIAWKASISHWVPATPQQQYQTVHSASAAIAAGQALKAVAGVYLALADGGAGNENVIGIAAHDAVANGQLVWVTHGLVLAKVTGAVVAGNRMKLSSTAGLLADAGTAALGSGMVGTAMMADSGGSCWISLKR